MVSRFSLLALVALASWLPSGMLWAQTSIESKVRRLDGHFHLGTYKLARSGDLEKVPSLQNDGAEWFRSTNEALSFYNIGTTPTFPEDVLAEYSSFGVGSSLAPTICGFELNYASNQADGTLQAEFRWYDGLDDSPNNNLPVSGGEFLINLPTPGGTGGIFGYTVDVVLDPEDFFVLATDEFEYGLRMVSGVGAFGPILQLNIPEQTPGQADSAINAALGTTFNGFSLFQSPGQPTGVHDGNYWFGATGPWAGASHALLAVPAGGATVDAAYVIHNGYTGGGSNIDTGKTLHKETETPTGLTYGNLINSSRGINGIGLDMTGTGDIGAITAADFDFQMSPTGAFAEGANPPAGWAAAPAPTSVVATAGTPDKIAIQWADNAIANRWLRITVKANANTGLGADEVYYIGHLLGEAGPTANPFTVTFADISPIRAGVGQTVNADSTLDIDKNGTVAFQDITSMRGNVSAQLTAVTVPPLP